MVGIDEQSGPVPQPEGTNAVNARSEEARSANDARDCTPAVEDAETAAVSLPVKTEVAVEENALAVPPEAAAESKETAAPQPNAVADGALEKKDVNEGSEMAAVEQPVETEGSVEEKSLPVAAEAEGESEEAAAPQPTAVAGGAVEMNAPAGDVKEGNEMAAVQEPVKTEGSVE